MIGGPKENSFYPPMNQVGQSIDSKKLEKENVKLQQQLQDLSLLCQKQNDQIKFYQIENGLNNNDQRYGTLLQKFHQEIEQKKLIPQFLIIMLNKIKLNQLILFHYSTVMKHKSSIQNQQRQLEDNNRILKNSIIKLEQHLKEIRPQNVTMANELSEKTQQVIEFYSEKNYQQMIQFRELLELKDNYSESYRYYQDHSTEFQEKQRRLIEILKSQQRSNEQLQKENEDIKIENQQLKSQISIFKSQLQQNNQERKKLLDQKENQDAKYINFDFKLQIKEEQINEQQLRYQTLQESYQNQQNQIENLNQQVYRLNQNSKNDNDLELEKLSIQNQQLQNENRLLKQDLEDSRMKIDQDNYDYQYKDDQILQLNAEIQKQKQEILKLKDKIQDQDIFNSQSIQQIMDQKVQNLNEKLNQDQNQFNNDVKFNSNYIKNNDRNDIDIRDQRIFNLEKEYLQMKAEYQKQITQLQNDKEVEIESIREENQYSKKRINSFIKEKETLQRAINDIQSRQSNENLDQIQEKELNIQQLQNQIETHQSQFQEVKQSKLQIQNEYNKAMQDRTTLVSELKIIKQSLRDFITRSL